MLKNSFSYQHASWQREQDALIYLSKLDELTFQKRTVMGPKVIACDPIYIRGVLHFVETIVLGFLHWGSSKAACYFRKEMTFVRVNMSLFSYLCPLK